jgi:hypothetical protein
MQIGSSNLLTFLSGSTPQATGHTKDQDADSARAKAASATANEGALSGIAPEPATAGVILSLQSDTAAAASTAVPKGLVYSNTGKSANSQNAQKAQSEQADTERMALQHSQALQRSAAASSSLGVDKDGVLVALPVSAGEVKAQAFVHHAVTAMRAYADEQDRLKTQNQVSAGTSGAALIPRSLAEVHKLAARFKLFA